MPSEEIGSVYVGGLRREVDSKALKEYFSKFGEIKEANVIRDRETKESKGYGFVTFVDQSIVKKVIGDKSHSLNGYKINVRQALSKPKDTIQTKIVFIRGISRQTKVEDVINYFERFGQIVDASLMMDHLTKCHTGLGFVTFDRYSDASKVCRQKHHYIKHNCVECEKVFVEEIVEELNEAKEQEKIALEEESFEQEQVEQALLEQEQVEQAVYEQEQVEQAVLEQENVEQAVLEQENLEETFEQANPNYYVQCWEPNYYPAPVYPHPMPPVVYIDPYYAPPMETIVLPPLPYPTMIYPNTGPMPNVYNPQYVWNGTNWSNLNFHSQ